MNDPACSARGSPSGSCDFPSGKELRSTGTRGFPSGMELYTDTAHGTVECGTAERAEESSGEDMYVPSLPRYFGDTYCCPACGTAFSLIRAEITGCGTGEGSGILRCPACRADNAVRVSDAELALVTGYVKLRGEARELIRQRSAKR